MANATQFIGSKISLISKSEIRYEGILYSLDVVEATISLAKVKSFGTEDRPTERPVPPKDEIYEFIIFRGSDIKGIDVMEPPKPSSSMNDGLPNDPAIVEVSHYHSSSTSSRTHHPTTVGPIPIQVQVQQASAAYAAGSSGTYGGSAFGGHQHQASSSSVTAPALPKSAPTNQQQSHSGYYGSTTRAESPERPPARQEPSNVVKESSNTNKFTPATDALSSKQIPQEGNQTKQPATRGNARHHNQRGGEERGRGGGRGRGVNVGSRGGRPQGFQQPQGQEALDHPRQQGQSHGYQGQGGYQPRGRGGGSGNYNNTSRGSGSSPGNYVSRGSGGYRGGYRNNRTQGILQAPQTAKVTFDNDFDFEKANEELQTAIKDLKLTEKVKEEATVAAENEVRYQVRHEAEEQENKEPSTCYKKDDFFDSISCEALERGKGHGTRPDWRAERKLNAETFGMTGQRRGGLGYFRGGGRRGYYNNRGGGGYGYGGYGGHRGGYNNSRGGSGYSSYNNRYNGGSGGRGRGRGSNNTNSEATGGSGSF